MVIEFYCQLSAHRDFPHISKTENSGKATTSAANSDKKKVNFSCNKIYMERLNEIILYLTKANKSNNLKTALATIQKLLEYNFSPGLVSLLL